jgi:succinyl-CoA synthetase beta subunit
MSKVQERLMNTHEYQAKEILGRYGIPIPRFGVAGSVKEAEQVLSTLKIKDAVVKVQVHAGGRGKAGGVKLGRGRDEVLQYAEKMIGMHLVTPQTGEEGVVAEKVMISELSDIDSEYYLGCIIDRDRAQPILIASPEGGVEIEEVAAKTPEKILTVPIGLDGRLRSYQLVRICKFMGWSGDQAKQARKILVGLAKAFIETDASLLEINPLVKTPDGDLVALDAKLSVDDNALYRQKEIAEFYDPTQVQAGEVQAHKHDLAYIALDGNIGCMVNGAGLAMATMDIIKVSGGSPANFLDVGGSATEEKVASGFNIILSDPKVKGVLVNIFGGIMNCATIAHGVIAAAKEQAIEVPLVVRMEGTNVDEGRRLLEESGLNIIAAKDLGEAAEKIVAAIGGGK